MKTWKQIRISAMIMMVLLILSCLHCWAVPQQINYQGKLTDADGVAVADSTLTMDFAIYDSDSGGAPLWSETQSVIISSGVFNVQLGQDPVSNPFPADLFSDNILYVGITVGIDNEMAPRQLLTSVPFALQAGDAEFAVTAGDAIALDGHGPEAFAPVVHTHNFLDITGSISDGQIPNAITRDTELDAGLATKADVIHNHDDRYYTKAYVDALEDSVNALMGRISALETLLANVTRFKDGLYFDSMNVYIRNGTGATDSKVNGLGNLIVGYNEERGSGDDRSGSHNIVVGSRQNYSYYGGLVAGYWSTISAPYASVSGGAGNTASEQWASVSGGYSNRATGFHSSVSGGRYNTASGQYSSVSGGGGVNYTEGNVAFGDYTAILGGYGNIAGDQDKIDHSIGQKATVSGGNNNIASGFCASVSGGYTNTASGGVASVGGGTGNTASEGAASVSGGSDNTASGTNSSISGGNHNTASNWYASVSGGADNTASEQWASVSGGYSNRATGFHSSVSGGSCNTASGQYSSVSGGGGENIEYGNEAFGDYTAILGGRRNIAGDPDKIDHTIGLQATVSGGYSNRASGVYASVSGGEYNIASNYYASVSGGYANVASGAAASVIGGYGNSSTAQYSSISGGGDNTASGLSSSITGGCENTASGQRASVSGGRSNAANEECDSISGGILNTASGDYSSVSGGRGNISRGLYASISGGHDRTIVGIYDWQAGDLFEDD